MGSTSQPRDHATLGQLALVDYDGFPTGRLPCALTVSDRDTSVSYNETAL
jgi:hypothetical protein